MGKSSREKKERRLEEANRKDFSPKRSFLERVYLSIIEWGTYVILFTPLVLVKSYFFPFVSPKTIFFRIIVDIIFIAYILLVVSNRRYLPKINALTISVIVFLGVLILTSFTGINFEKSFWSTFERMTGILTFLHLFVFFIILTSVFRERKYWERILIISILVGVILSVYVLVSDVASTRGGGTIGNVSFMAAYLLFDIFFAITLFLAKPGFWRIFYGLTLSVMLSTLFFSAELPRGAIGAFFPGVFLLALGYMVFSKKKLLKRLAPVLLVLVVLIGAAATQTDFFKKNMMDIREFPGGAREIVWQMGFEAWKERPWLGWGPENFNVPFAKYFDPKLPVTGDVWYDRVHNIVLDVSVTSGILGLLSYLAIFGVSIFGLLKVCPKVAEKRNLFFPLGMIVLLIVYFFQNFWVFDMISTYMMFFLSLAFASFLIEGMKPRKVAIKEGEVKGRWFYSFFGALLILATIFTLYFGNIQPARASRAIIEGITSPLEKAIPAFQKAIEISPMSKFEVPEQFSKKLTNLVYDPKQDRKLLEEGLELSAKEMEKAIASNPQDFRFYLLLGRHYNDFYNLTHDGEKLSLAEKTLEKAVELSPQNQQVYWSLAQTRLFQERTDEAVELMRKSVDLDPQFDRPHWYLAMTYRVIGKNELALEKVKDAERAGYNWRGNLEDLKKVIGIYQDLKDDKGLVELYPLAIEREPENAKLWAGLAVAYANLGQFEKARDHAKKAMELNPDFIPQLEEFLKSLPR